MAPRKANESIFWLPKTDHVPSMASGKFAGHSHFSNMHWAPWTLKKREISNEVISPSFYFHNSRALHGMSATAGARQNRWKHSCKICLSALKTLSALANLGNPNFPSSCAITVHKCATVSILADPHPMRALANEFTAEGARLLEGALLWVLAGRAGTGFWEVFDVGIEIGVNSG